MDIFKIIDMMERVELAVSELYKALYDEYKQHKGVADFFMGLHMEEESHVQMIRMERRIIQAAPKAFTKAHVNLTEINSILETVENLKKQKLPLPELIGRIYALESNPAEKYLVEALKDTNEELRDFLTRLGQTFDAHAEQIATFANKMGIQITEIQNRYLRKVRVAYADKVLINKTLSVRGVDISEGGMFVLTGRSFPVNETVSMQFSLMPDTIATDATVQFVIEGVGMGVRFTTLSDIDQKTLVRYMERRIEEMGLEKQKRLLLIGNAKRAGQDLRWYMHDLLGAGYKAVDISGFKDSLHFLRKGVDLSCIVMSIETETESNYWLLHYLSTFEQYTKTPLLVMSNNQSKEFHETMRSQRVRMVLPRISTSPKRLTEVVNSIIV